jgi:hypothetical protein
MQPLLVGRNRDVNRVVPAWKLLRGIGIPDVQIARHLGLVELISA